MTATNAVCHACCVGHNGWVTSVGFRNNTLVTASRDKSLLIWDVLDTAEEYARPKQRLLGHAHFIQEIALSVDGQFALSASWDGTTRLWNLVKGVSLRSFVGHSKDVLSVAFSGDNRLIMTGSRDGTARIWNTIGDHKISIQNHSDWISCVRFAAGANPFIITASWDKTIRVFNSSSEFSREAFVLNCDAAVTALDVAPDGSLCASGDKDGHIRLWDLNDGRVTEELSADEAVNALCFSPKSYWLCAATKKGIKIWDLEKNVVLFELTSKAENFNILPRNPNPECLSLCWSENGEMLFAGYTDSALRVWKFTE